MIFVIYSMCDFYPGVSWCVVATLWSILSNMISLIRILKPVLSPTESTAEFSRFAYESSRSRALSLLSSKASPWISTPDLPSRSSAALRELIAENRAATLAHQLISEHGCWRDNIAPLQHKREPQSHRAPTSQLANIWSRQLQDPGNNLNADIMQMPPGSSLDIFSRIGLL